MRLLASVAGHRVLVDDDEGLALVHKDGPEITLTATEITLKVGSTKLVLSSSGVSINDGAFEVR